MKNVRWITSAALLMAALVIAACAKQATPTPTPEPTATPTEALPTAQPVGGVDVAWEHVSKPEVPVVARVNGVEITSEAYLAEVRQQLYQVTAQYGIDWYDERMVALLPTFQNQILQEMIQEQLGRQLAAAEGLTVDEALHASELANLQNDVLQSGQYASWEDFLAKMGWTQADLEEQLTTYLIFQMLLKAHGGPTEVEQVHAAHILVETEETGKEVLEKLQAGADFAALAAEYSIDTGSKDQGGDLGWFPRGVMVSEFEEAAFALNPGETSELVSTDYGYHIIRVLGKEVRPLDPELLPQIQEQNFQKWFDEQLEKATIETLVNFESEP
ncbi:MAG: peptidylprolyl isomerase [Chloroflexi bacterium]|nr:peptidylprolyl isomerase [Chloroflexota bacterium]